MPNALRGCATGLTLVLALGVAAMAQSQEIQEEADAQPAVTVPAPEPLKPPVQASPEPPALSEKDFTRAKVLSEPTPDDVRALYPQAARAKALGGRAMVVCEIALSTQLENCVVTQEDPTGLGFGDAAIKVAQMYRVAPPVYLGKPVPHAKFTLPMRYEMELPTSEQLAQDRARDAEPASETPTQRAARLGPLRRSDEVLWAPVGFGLIVLVGIAWAVLWPPPERRPRRKAGQLA